MLNSVVVKAKEILKPKEISVIELEIDSDEEGDWSEKTIRQNLAKMQALINEVHDLFEKPAQSLDLLKLLAINEPVEKLHQIPFDLL